MNMEVVNIEQEELDEYDVFEVKNILKFNWINRLGCVEALATECADNGGKYDRAFKTVRVREFCLNLAKMPIKQKTMLKRDVLKLKKEILLIRESADVGDIVRVPKMVPNPLLSADRREGNKLFEAIVLEKRKSSHGYHYRFERLLDKGIQSGNGHMIKGLVRRGADEKHG